MSTGFCPQRTTRPGPSGVSPAHLGRPDAGPRQGPFDELALAEGVGVAVDLQTLAQGDEFHMQERINVALTRSVVLEILDNEGMVWVERAIGESTPIHTPAGTFVGPEGAIAFATLLAGGEEDRGFELHVVGADGDLVELDWRLAGPLTPGIVKGEYIPEGSYVSGRVTATVIDGSVEEMSFLVE